MTGEPKVQHATAEQQALRDSASRFLAQQCDFARHRRRQQQHPAEFDRALWTRMGELGWLGVMLAEEVGGLGQTPQAALALVEAMGGQFVSEPYAPALAAAQLLQTLGKPGQQARWLPALCTGAALVLPAHAEPGARARLTCVQTRAVRDGEGHRLDGRKNAVPWGQAADAWLVSARTAGPVDDPAGISLFIVPRDAAGLRLELREGIAGEPLADLVLDGVRMPQDALLGSPGQAHAALEAAHAFLLAAACAEAVGTLQAVLQATRDYACTRQQFGAPLARFQVIAHRLVDMFTQVQLARSMAQLAAQLLDTPGDAATQSLRLSACKAQVSVACHFVGEQAVQIHGGIGMTDELALSHQVRRLLAIERCLGDRFHHLGVLSERVMQGEGLYA